MRKHLFFALLLLVSSGILLGQSQILNRKVRIENREGTIGSILEEIEKNGGFFFSFNEDIPKNKKVRLHYTLQTVQQYLDEIFSNSIYCVEIGNNLLIIRKPELPDFYTVRGMVVNSLNGEPDQSKSRWLKQTPRFLLRVDFRQRKSLTAIFVPGVTIPGSFSIRAVAAWLRPADHVLVFLAMARESSRMTMIPHLIREPS